MDEIVWEDPGPVPYGVMKGHWRDVMEAVAQRPGEWARIRTATQGRCQSTKQALKNASYLDADEWELTVRKVDDNGDHALYARYTPKPKAVSA